MKPELDFEHNEENGKLHVTLTTERLFMESVIQTYFDGYHRILSQPVVMEKYGDGIGWDLPNTTMRFNSWKTRWQQGDPFSAFAISKSDEDQLIGHVVLGHDSPGKSQLAYVVDKPFWGKGYGKEAVLPIVNLYATELVKRHYQLDGEDFSSINADVRADNEASIKILKAAGMSKIKDKIEFGHPKFVFYKSLKSESIRDLSCELSV